MDVMQLLAAFLLQRSMKVKVSTSWSEVVNAGAPQASVLGCDLFSLRVDDLVEG